MKRLTFFMFVFSFVIICITLFFTYGFVRFSIHTMEENIEQHTVSVVKQLSYMVSIEELDRYRETADMQTIAYQKLHARLRDFAKESGVFYAFFIRLQGEDTLQYVIDNDYNEKTRVGLDTPPMGYGKLPLLKEIKTKGQGHVCRPWQLRRRLGRIIHGLCSYV